MSKENWKTGITAIQANEVRLRGYRIDELMGKITFGQAIYLAIMGDLPSNAVAKMIEAVLVSSVDHGAVTPSTLATRTAASTGAPLNAAVACGLLSINRFHGGAIEGCMEMLNAALQADEGLDRPINDIASAVINEHREQERRLPGLGHRLHTDDPRTRKLFQLAEDLNLAGKGVELLQAINKTLESQGKPLPINVDGAIAAILVDLDIPSPLANAFFFMARLPGLVAHVYEEQSRERPMRRIHPSAHEYDGPAPRSFKDPQEG